MIIIIIIIIIDEKLQVQNTNRVLKILDIEQEYNLGNIP